MSLINDALRRAKQAQQEAHAPLAGPALRPVDPPPYVRHGLGVFLPVTMTVVALLGLLLLWQVYQRRGSIQPHEPSVQTGVKAQDTAPAVPAQAALSRPAASPTEKAPAATPTSAKPEPKAPAPVAAAAAPVPATPAAAAVPLSTTNAGPETATVSNAAPPAPQPVLPKPEPLKLQGIVYDLKRPSAVVNGRTLFLGDRILGFRITAIHANSVTLVGGGRTNVLSLEP